MYHLIVCACVCVYVIHGAVSYGSANMFVGMMFVGKPVNSGFHHKQTI